MSSHVAQNQEQDVAGISACPSGVAVDGALSIGGRSGETVEWQRWAGHHDDLWASSGNTIRRILVGVWRIFLDDSDVEQLIIAGSGGLWQFL